MPPIEQRIDEYELRGLLGRGGMGEVYQAWQPSLQRLVALKMLPDWLAEHPGALARFQREAAVAAQLDHPNIVPIHACGQSGQRYYYTMKLVQGCTLSSLIARQREARDAAAPSTKCEATEQEATPVVRPADASRAASQGTVAFQDNSSSSQAPADAESLGGEDTRPIEEEFERQRYRMVVQMGEKLARALAYAHKHGQLHRDIKPSNIMIDIHRQVYLIDFGLTRAIGPEISEVCCGTPGYMSPEQLNLQELDNRTDIYGLGVTLYEALALQSPFATANPAELARMIRKGQAVPLADVAPELPRRLTRCIHRAMAPRAARRFPTAEALADELAACSESTVIPPSSSSGLPAPLSKRRFWRRPAVLASAGALVAAIVLASVIGLMRGDNAPAPPRPAPDATPAHAGLDAKPRREAPADDWRQARVFRNSIGMEFTKISVGKFVMGSPIGEAESLDAERPQRDVTISKPFFLGIFEVTQGEYERVMGHNPSAHVKPGVDTSRLPVEMVSYDDAVEFCRKLSALPEEKQAGRNYRLPYEAEWEFACRAGTNTPFHHGYSLSSEQENFMGKRPYGGAPEGPARGQPTPVGEFAPNAFGLYDMHGNVMEWCADRYSEYTSKSQVDPIGADATSTRVVRGGGFSFAAKECRSARRHPRQPTSRYHHQGFRVVGFARSD